MITLKGRVVEGARDFCWRMTEFSDAFRDATGEYLYPGTLNVKIDREIPLTEQFRVKGNKIGQPGHDVVFEICRVNRLWAYRVRSCNTNSSDGGHGDDVIEIICAQKVPNALPGNPVTLELLRDDVSEPKLLLANPRASAEAARLRLPILRRVDPQAASHTRRKVGSATR